MRRSNSKAVDSCYGAIRYGFMPVYGVFFQQGGLNKDVHPTFDSPMTPLRRRTVTLFCFLMAVSILSSIFIYVDSNSLTTWSECNRDVGPVAMRVIGDNLHLALDEIRNIPHVTQASLVETAPAYLRMDKDLVYVGSPDDPFNPTFLLQGNAYALSDDFIINFPEEFEIVEGRYPMNSSEIALTYADAAEWNIPIGRMMNYTHTLNGEKRTIFVVGFFKLECYDAIRYAAAKIIAIVTSDVLNPLATKTLGYIDVDRDILSPGDPRGSLSLLLGIEDSIARTDPSDMLYSNYFVDNYLAMGVQSYLDSLNLQRIRQISRTQSLLLLTGIMGFLAVRFNITSRESEMDFHVMRGASRIRILRLTMVELWLLSILSSALSIVLGLFLSGLAGSSNGYLDFSFEDSFGSPLLLTIDTVVVLGLAGFLLPAIGYVTHKAIRTVTSVETGQSQLAKIVRNIRLVRWDVATTLLGILLILTLYIGGQSVSGNAVLVLIASLVPIPLFLAIASMFKKSIVRLTMPLSRLLRKATGKIPATVGIRGVAIRDNMALPVILIVSLTLSSCLISNIVATSLPNTHLFQTRYLIGGDLSFHLDNGELGQWSDFSEAVLQQEDAEAASLVSIGFLSLSEGAEGIVEFIAISPEQYRHVGYSHTGEELDSSSQSGFLLELEANPEGAILTSDIASEYNLILGDTLRVFSFWDISITTEFNIVGVTDAIPRPKVIGQATSESVVGTREVWLNRNHLGALIDLNATAETFLCARVSDGANATEIGEDALEDYESVIHSQNEWSSATAELDSFYAVPRYCIDRAIDNMLTINLAFCMFAALIAFQVDRQRIDRGCNALLKLLGAPKKLLVRTRYAEVLALILFSFLLVAIFSSISIANTLRIELLEYSTWRYTFPVSIFAFADWSGYLWVAVFLLVPSVVLTTALSTRSDKRSIASVLEDIELFRKTRFVGETS